MDSYRDLLNNEQRYGIDRYNNRYNNRGNNRHNKINSNDVKAYWAKEILKNSDWNNKDYTRASKSTEQLNQLNYSHQLQQLHPLRHHQQPYQQQRPKNIFSPNSNQPSKTDSKTRSESGYAPSIQSEENDASAKQTPLSPGFMEDTDSADEGVIRSHFRNTPNTRTPSFGSQPGKDLPNFRVSKSGSIRRIGINHKPSFNTECFKSPPLSSSTNHTDPISYWESKWMSDTNKRAYKNYDDIQINNIRTPNLSNYNEDIFKKPSKPPNTHSHHYSTDNLLENHSRTSKRSDSTQYSYNDNNNYDRRYINNTNNNRSNSSYNNFNNKNSNINSRSNSNRNNDSDFLSKVQLELEQQRMHWTSEIDKLLSPMTSETNNSNRFHFGPSPQNNPPRKNPAAVFNAEKNSYVDTNGSLPIFKAFVDVSDYPASSVTVGLDNLGNKVIIGAGHDGDAVNNVAMTFTQKIPLPRYADLANMTAKVNSKGLVKVEIPLLFYFLQDHPTQPSTHFSTTHSFSNSSFTQPPTNNSTHHPTNQPTNRSSNQQRTVQSNNSTHDQSRREAYGKSFVSEVVTDQKGNQTMEIVVKAGPGFSPDDVVVEVVDERFLVVGVEVGADRGAIKTYGLPDTADLAGIRSRLNEDGLVIVSIPLRS